jgi:diguanylate cyclase (GGDEF)-like protein
MPKTNKGLEPEAVYIPFVQSLFRDAGALAIGVFSQTLAALLAFVENGHPVYLITSVVLVASGLIRVIAVQLQQNAGPPKTFADARRMESWYIALASLHGFCMGFFCFAGIYIAPSSFAELASVTVMMASVSSIVGRNYGSARMVAILIAVMVGPYFVALMLRWDFFHVALAIQAVPLFIAINTLARRVRNVLRKAIEAQYNSELIARRFDKALNTMSHGLMMFDPMRRVMVINEMAMELFMFRSRSAAEGRTLKSLVMRGVAAKLFSEHDKNELERRLTRPLETRSGGKTLVKLRDGRHIEFTSRGGEGEFDVITFEDVTSRVNAEAQILHMARYDALTGLSSRAYFTEVVGAMLRSGDRERECAFILFDLDDFKSVNDTLGHPVGDALIFSVTQILRNFTTEDMKLSRFGGDEFLLFMNNVKDKEDISRLLERVFAKFEEYIDVGGHLLQINLSAGASMEIAAKFDVNRMIVHADLALYGAKNAGKNGWKIFEDAMEADFREKQMLRTELRAAVLNEELRVVYQPIVNARTMKIATCEALCRWDHKVHGPISPSVFIPLAEEIGIVGEISRYVLRRACQDCASWPDGTSVAVNLSARDFKSDSVTAMISEALIHSGLPPERLEVEVTETALLDDKAKTAKHLKAIKSLGVRVALDDFGTGYSSLSYLHRLPLDKVKIDQTFVSEILTDKRSVALVKSIASMCRDLGLTITIEGVETEEQLMTLADHVPLDQVQGFLFGSSLPALGVQRMAQHVWPYAGVSNKVRAAMA